jgi:hypothetical protein
VRKPQPTLFDQRRHAERYEAAERAAIAYSATWKLSALGVFRDFLATQGDREFLAETLKAWAESNSSLAAPPDGRAWGAVLLAAKRLGIVHSTGRFELDQFASPKTLWRRS